MATLEGCWRPAVLQQARVTLHPVYFDHNAVYHPVQTIAVVFLYLGVAARTGPGSGSRAA